ncbi:hypothetical protein ACHQM5_014050 [Ranunculus cassubicifolius]
MVVPPVVCVDPSSHTCRRQFLMSVVEPRALLEPDSVQLFSDAESEPEDDGYESPIDIANSDSANENAIPGIHPLMRM